MRRRGRRRTHLSRTELTTSQVLADLLNNRGIALYSVKQILTFIIYLCHWKSSGVMKSNILKVCWTFEQLMAPQYRDSDVTSPAARERSTSTTIKRSQSSNKMNFKTNHKAKSIRTTESSTEHRIETSNFKSTVDSKISDAGPSRTGMV